ncbi:MAG TPA: amidohydrolase [Acidimicrobiia bacterium]|nr:amidohydrolase [Acidimicrobiia bacterium]
MLDTSNVVTSVLPTVVDVRRAIHRRPELSKHEFATTDLIAAHLAAARLTPRLRTPKSGLTVDVGTDGPLVVFRADLDALPITEPAGLAFASETSGVMHACGHDAHTAITLGLALAWAEVGAGRRVRFLFQPSEEVFPGGADEMVVEGAVSGAQAVIAFHVDPHLRTGFVGVKPGAITSSADRFSIVLEGPGGHTARPHETVDVIHAAGHVIANLSGIVSRLLDARAPLAITFGQVHGGAADNVIPTSVRLSGTARTPDHDVWERVPELIRGVAADLAAPFGAKVEIRYNRGLPPVRNDAALVARLTPAIERALGPETVTDTHTSMGGEDFALYLTEAPGALFRLGCAANPTETNDLHSASFMLDERALEVGLHAGLEILRELTA